MIFVIITAQLRLQNDKNIQQQNSAVKLQKCLMPKGKFIYESDNDKNTCVVR